MNNNEQHYKPEFVLRHISFSRYAGSWQGVPHSHHFSEIFFVLKGNSVFHIDNQLVSVAPNDLMVINPHIEHTEQTLSDTPAEYIVLGIEGLAFSFPDAEDESAKGYHLYSCGPDGAKFIQLARIMMREFQEKKPDYETVCNGLLQVLLVYISRRQNLSMISNSTFRLSKECALAKRYIDMNYSKPITLDELAAVSNINKYYLVHSFTEYMGQSPINYLNEKRLEASKELLTSSNLSIAQVASSAGFSSQSYFSQIFKKKTGITPQQYRKQKSGT